jgi:microsomal triglyceride transfer protein large subunit
MSGLPQSRLALEIEEYLLNSLTSCEGKDKGICQQQYLRALKNLKSKSSIPILLEVLTTSDSKTSVVAMKAIHAMPDTHIDIKYRPTLLKIIKQLGRKYDSSVRTLALDVILRSHPSKPELKDIVTFLLEKVMDKQHAEVSTFMWNRIHEFMESNLVLRDYLEEIIREESLVTYHHLSPRGLSTAFTRVFTANPSGNSTFSNAIEMNGKILKRSLFDVNVKTKHDALQLLSVLNCISTLVSGQSNL